MKAYAKPPVHGRRHHRTWGDMTPHFQTQEGTGGHNLGIILISLFLTEA